MRARAECQVPGMPVICQLHFKQTIQGMLLLLVLLLMLLLHLLHGVTVNCKIFIRRGATATGDGHDFAHTWRMRNVASPSQFPVVGSSEMRSWVSLSDSETETVTETKTETETEKNCINHFNYILLLELCDRKMNRTDGDGDGVAWRSLAWLSGKKTFTNFGILAGKVLPVSPLDMFGVLMARAHTQLLD